MAVGRVPGRVSRPDRPRYVAFRVDAEKPVDFDDVVAALRERDDEAWLVDFDGEEGVVRCPHTRRDATVELLVGLDEIGGAGVDVETLGTSGTVRACRRKFLG